MSHDPMGTFEEISELKQKMEMIAVAQSERTMAATAVRTYMGQTIAAMRSSKPNDRSEQDRYWAICITDMEKVIATFEMYVIRNGG